MKTGEKALAKAVNWAVGTASTGTPQLGVLFEITDGPERGQRYLWYGHFTEETWERTVDAMRVMGWDERDPMYPAGLNINKVELVFDEQEYQGRVVTRVAWVNRPLDVRMRGEVDAAEFRRVMRDRLQKQASKTDDLGPDDDDNIPY